MTDSRAGQDERVACALDTARLEQMLASWRPMPSAAADLRRMHAAALNTGAARAIRATAQDAELGERVSALLPRLVESTWTGPDVAHAYYVDLAHGRRPSPARAEAAVAELARASRGRPPPLRLSRDGDLPAWIHHALRSFEAEGHREGRETELRPCDVDADTIERYRRAHETLAAGWPEMASVFDLFVREIVWYEADGPGYASATLTQAFGAMFVNRTAPELVESLVHEATHLELTARMAYDRLIVNRDDSGKSPFRKRARPLGRVLHAGFVSARVAVALDRCTELVPVSQRDIMRSRRDKAFRDLHTSLDTLREHARWTTCGEQLFASLDSEVSLAASV